MSLRRSFILNDDRNNENHDTDEINFYQIQKDNNASFNENINPNVYNFHEDNNPKNEDE